MMHEIKQILNFKGGVAFSYSRYKPLKYNVIFIITFRPILPAEVGLN